MIRESKRNNPNYRQHAMASLGDFIELRVDMDLYDKIYEITEPVILETVDDTDDMDVDSKSGGLSSKLL